MEKKKSQQKMLNTFIIILCAMILVLLFYRFFYKKWNVTFTFYDKDIKLRIGETKKIDYNLSNSDLIIEWNSNDDSVSVNSTGEITANKYGHSIITGTIKDGDKTLSNSCDVTVYSGEIGVSLSHIDVPKGYLLMKPNSSFTLSYDIVPFNAYVTKIDYYSNNTSVANIDNNSIISLNEGEANLYIYVNNEEAKIPIKVSSDVNENKFVELINQVSFKEQEIEIEIGDTKTINYEISPSNGFIESVEWLSSNDSIVSVSNGEITALNAGEVTITVVVNNNLEAKLMVKVKPSNADIKIEKSPRTTIKVGEKTEIVARLEPSNNKEVISYSSSNNSIVTVDQNGIITGINAGSSIITLSLKNGKTRSFTINVLPSKGIINGAANLWGYSSLDEHIPVLADISFFQNLAQSGKGVLNGNTYIVSTSDTSYSYDIYSNILTANNKKVKARFYYPTGKDLSSLNTLTYLGGDGELDFDEYFTQIASNPSIIKSSGIVALVPKGTNTSFDGDAGAYVTKFMNLIFNQKTGAKNSLLGFSAGGILAMDVALKYDYDRIIIYSAYCYNPSNMNSLKNKEIMFYIPQGDKLYLKTRNTLSEMKSSGYQNITIVTNSKELSTMFGDKFLVINTGSLMLDGHLSANVGTSGVIAYAND